MDITTIITTAISLAAAIFAAWQAVEATKSRKAAAKSQQEASESSARAARSAEIAAEAQRKLAEAQETMTALAKKHDAANRRNIFLRRTTGRLYVITNHTGETITNVELQPTMPEQAVRMSAETVQTMGHGDEHEVLLPYSGMYEIHWIDSDGNNQVKKTEAANPNA
ncbi:hypothetical protein G7Y31_06875 [Corynebacterium lizhenjunii]|uniref:Uncharacterized protein n=1 Tax=Corynebacterium lizhenjunii TaxID=2709394 RepID=A0A7T0KD19_9CORY|nr:hypothetical protein [Corynebacterium lizhenjunii]QPK78307.1 hypothetical protein G7Y31_06875 [Corynebacterium lizhenjunii]